MTTVAKRRFPWWVYWIVLAVILVVALAPLISVIIAGSIAEANGCALDEGSVHACIVGGNDMGSTLYAMGVMGWFMIATIPLGAGAVLVWVVVLIAHRLYWGRKTEGTPNG